MVLYDSKFWNRTINFKSFVDAKLVSAQDLDLFTMADTPQQAWDQLNAHGLYIPKEP